MSIIRGSSAEKIGGYKAPFALVAVAGSARGLRKGRRTRSSVAELGKVAVAVVLQEVDLSG
ncbi:MAG: hypothetical protein K9J78_06235 [Polynucleobacter sp.]|nr:hypothetical protein [Polynucleobacter sp.]